MDAVLPAEPVGRGAGPRTRGAPPDRDRRAPRAWHGARRGTVGRAAQAGERAPHPRGHLRHEYARRRRDDLAGPALWSEAAPTQSRVHGGGALVARAGHWREYRDLPAARRGTPAVAPRDG